MFQIERCDSPLGGMAANPHAAASPSAPSLADLLNEANDALLDTEDDDEEADARDEATPVIQAFMRGYLCRADLQDQVAAVTAMQAHVRGFLVRAALFDEFAAQHLDRATDPRFHALHTWQLHTSFEARVEMLRWRGYGAWRDNSLARAVAIWADRADELHSVRHAEAIRMYAALRRREEESQRWLLQRWRTAATVRAAEVRWTGQLHAVARRHHAQQSGREYASAKDSNRRERRWPHRFAGWARKHTRRPALGPPRPPLGRLSARLGRLGRLARLGRLNQRTCLPRPGLSPVLGVRVRAQVF